MEEPSLLTIFDVVKKNYELLQHLVCRVERIEKALFPVTTTTSTTTATSQKPFFSSTPPARVVDLTEDMSERRNPSSNKRMMDDDKDKLEDTSEEEEDANTAFHLVCSPCPTEPSCSPMPPSSSTTTTSSSTNVESTSTSTSPSSSASQTSTITAFFAPTSSSSIPSITTTSPPRSSSTSPNSSSTARPKKRQRGENSPPNANSHRPLAQTSIQSHFSPTQLSTRMIPPASQTVRSSHGLELLIPPSRQRPNLTLSNNDVELQWDLTVKRVKPALYQLQKKSYEIHRIRVQFDRRGPTMEAIKNELKAQFDVSPLFQRVYLLGREHVKTENINDLKNGCTIVMLERTRSTFPITVKIPNIDDLSLDVDPDDFIYELKQFIKEKTGTVESHQRIVFLGQQLRDYETISKYKIAEGANIHMFPRTQSSLN